MATVAEQSVPVACGGSHFGSAARATQVSLDCGRSVSTGRSSVPPDLATDLYVRDPHHNIYLRLVYAGLFRWISSSGDIVLVS